MLDFSDTGDIGLLIDAAFVALREAMIGKRRYSARQGTRLHFGTLARQRSDLALCRRQLSQRRDARRLRPAVLGFRRVNLPGPMYCWYTRNTYLENNIKVPGKTTQCGTPIDLSKIKAAAYLLASREDHIVPWKRAYLRRTDRKGCAFRARRKRPCCWRHQSAGEEQAQPLDLTTN